MNSKTNEMLDIERYPYLKLANEFRPDWFAVYSLKEAEKELGRKFNEPGWYIFKTDTLLMLPAFSQDGTDYFEFLVYNERNPVEAFNQIVNAPVRKDER